MRLNTTYNCLQGNSLSVSTLYKNWGICENNISLAHSFSENRSDFLDMIMGIQGNIINLLNTIDTDSIKEISYKLRIWKSDRFDGKVNYSDMDRSDILVLSALNDLIRLTENPKLTKSV
ncbi:MAG: hypothetical protein ACWA5L_08100 [bacterium]